MSSERLKVDRKPFLSEPALVLGFNGWMDGGDVSTGTVEYLIRQFDATEFAGIEPAGFYIYSFPGTMEFSALFRPHTEIEDGLVKRFDEPANVFHVSEKQDLVFFLGKEPNLAWSDYGDCVFELCRQCKVRKVLFIGSVAGVTPHTREPRFWCSVSNADRKAELAAMGLTFSNYEGPASIITFLTRRAAAEEIDMISLVAEVPAYIQGYNPRCIQAAVRHVGGILGFHVEIDALRVLGDEFEKRVNEAIEDQPELREKIVKLEADYDEHIFDTEMPDLKQWLRQQGIRLD